MARRRYLIAYDIRDPQRLRRICKLMEAHGERLQYSVFICDLSRGELAQLTTRSGQVPWSGVAGVPSFRW